ncbi:hypothetical protein WJX81_000919 [Elliptochloris bilobata]|uniref:tRNA-intron lyase n=1 Tax=Elliptochloris bilobata TaxID=381761 RepID=A0AAW1R2C8_9CHLO
MEERPRLQRKRRRRVQTEPSPQQALAALAAGAPLAGLGSGQGGAATAVRLSLEEAVFLAHALRSMRVLVAKRGAHSGLTELTIEELWRTCLRLRGDFLVAYIAYHHFRAKGWVALSGLKYGADLAFRRDEAAPPAEGQPGRLQLGSRVLMWNDLEAANRLCTQVKKRLMLLFVGCLPGTPSTSTPAVLDWIAVEERVVRRWVPQRDAQNL